MDILQDGEIFYASASVLRHNIGYFEADHLFLFHFYFRLKNICINFSLRRNNKSNYQTQLPVQNALQLHITGF